MTRDEILVAEAAAETLERIRRDRRTARAQVEPLLAKIQERLLDDELTVASLRRWCQVHDKNVSTMFARDLGLAPWDYVTDCRMEVAERLLAGSDLAVWEIASIVGYTTAQSFSRVFKRLRGRRPTDHRRAARRSSGPPPATPPPAGGDPGSAPASAMPPPLASLEESARALARNLDPEQARELLLRMDTFGRRLRSAWSEVSLFLNAIEHLLAEEYRKQGLIEQPGENDP